MNSVVLIGQLSETPKFFYVNKELCCTLNLNVQRNLKVKRRHTCNRNAQTIDSIPVVLWEKQARFARRHFKNSSCTKRLVMITGEIHICYYINNNQLQWTPKVIGDNIVIVD